MTSKDIIKLAVAGVLIAIAIVTYSVMSSAEEGVPDSEDTKTVWYCKQCDKGFELSGTQMADMVGQRRASELESDAGGSDEPVARGHGKGRFVRVAKCTSCNDWNGLAARKCPTCVVIFAAEGGEGTQASCPKCNWDPQSGDEHGEGS